MNVITPCKRNRLYHMCVQVVQNFQNDPTPFLLAIRRGDVYDGVQTDMIMYVESLFDEATLGVNVFKHITNALVSTITNDAATWRDNTKFYALLASALKDYAVCKIQAWNCNHFQRSVQFELRHSLDLDMYIGGPQQTHRDLNLVLSVRVDGPDNKPVRSIVLRAPEGKLCQIRNIRYAGAIDMDGPLLVEFSGEARVGNGEYGSPYLFRLRAKGTPQCQISNEKLHLYLIDLFDNVLTG
jgi:hypothetical protein